MKASVYDRPLRILKVLITPSLHLAVIISLIWFGWIEWPGLHWDADYFSSALMNVAQNNSWTFDSYSPFLINRSTNVYDSHGVFHIWFYAKLLQVNDWKSLTISMALVNSVTYILWAYLYNSCLRKHSVNSPWLKANLLAIVPELICLGLQGRPEQLAPLLLGLPFVGKQFGWGANQRRFSVGVVLGCLFLLSPLVGLIACLSYMVWVVSNRRESIKLSINLIIVFILMIIVSFFGIHLFTPVEFVPWVQNLRSGGTSVPFSWLIPNRNAWVWGTTLVAPFWSVIIFTLLFIVMIRIVFRRQWMLCFGSILSISWIIQRALDYSYIPFLPLIMLLWLDEKLFVPHNRVVKNLCLKVFPQIFELIYAFVILQKTLYSL